VFHPQPTIRRSGRLRAAAAGLVAAVLAATVAVVMTPTPASAAVSLFYKFDSTAFNSSAYKSLFIPCPAGMRTVGGSFDIGGAEGSVVLDDFIPSEFGLTVGAGEIVGPGEASDGTTANWLINATLVCASGVTGLSIIRRDSDFTVARTQEATAPCPPGRTAISGGASLSNGFGQVSIPRLSVEGTSVTAWGRTDQDGYPGNWSVTAYAICADPLPNMTKPVVRSAPISRRSWTEDTYCPVGQPAVGVGWRIYHGDTDQGDRYVSRAAIVPSIDPHVTVTVVSPNTSSVWSMDAAAVCGGR
jgi:hypothetical protein